MEINYLVFWGIFGMIVELCFTALRNLIQKKQLNLMGHTSLWMFPVYALGLTYGFDFVKFLIADDLIRYLSYPLWIWGPLVESPRSQRVRGTPAPSFNSVL